MSAFKHLSHEFLVVAGPPDGYHYGGVAEYLVDPRFREQFDIPQVRGSAAILRLRCLHAITDGCLCHLPGLFPRARFKAVEFRMHNSCVCSLGVSSPYLLLLTKH